MPEPVVIIGPAARPAEPIAVPAKDATKAAADDSGEQPQDPPKSGKGKISVLLSALAYVAKRLFRIVARGVLVIAKGVMSVARRYPRHSLAAAASVLILGAIWYTQMSPDKGARGPVTTQIKGESSSAAAKDANPAVGPKTDGAAATPEKTTTAGTEKPGAAKPVDTVTAQGDASPSAATSAPAPATHDDANPPLPALAAAPADEKESAPAPVKGAAPADLSAPDKAGSASSQSSAPTQSTPTLLTGSLPEPAPPASSPVTGDDKGSGEALKPAPAVDAPAPVALTPSPGAQGEPTPLPAPTSDSLALAAKLEPAGDQNKSTQPVGASSPDNKPKDAAAPAETTTAPAPPVGTPISSPESTKTEPTQSEPPKSESPKVQEPAPAAAGPAPKTEAPVASPGTLELAPPGADAAGTAKPSLEGSAPGVETSPPGDQSAVSQPAIPVPPPVAAAAPDHPKTAPLNAENNSRKPAAKQDEAPSKARATQDLDSDGWVSVPNSGKLPVEGMQDGDVASAGAASDTGAMATRDARAHAGKDASFELESPRSRGTPDLEQNGGRGTAGAGTAVESRSRSTAGRVESVPHVVERSENFWTISRLYYSSGRYYRALWKANADTHPDIKKLKVNDVIIVPPVEDLDPAYIDPPRGRATAELSESVRQSGSLARAKSRDDIDESSVSSSVATRDVPTSTARTNRDTVEGVPVRRSSRTDPDLDLPPPDAVARRAPAPDRYGRRVGRPIGDDDSTDEEPAIRTVARPRGAGSVTARRPVYKIRPFDTLRSIARDMLGDSHRASEILDLNRDLIDDPSHLIVGQVLELPEDARTSVRR